MARLESLTIRGFKTIRELVDFRLGDLTVLIGPNGAGKSNLISFFRLLSKLAEGNHREWVAREGGASALLLDGPAVTPEIEASIIIGPEFREFRFHLS